MRKGGDIDAASTAARSWPHALLPISEVREEAQCRASRNAEGRRGSPQAGEYAGVVEVTISENPESIRTEARRLAEHDVQF